MQVVSYVESVMTLAACKENYDEMTKEEFAEACLDIAEEDGHFKNPETTHG